MDWATRVSTRVARSKSPTLKRFLMMATATPDSMSAKAADPLAPTMPKVEPPRAAAAAGR